MKVSADRILYLSRVITRKLKEILISIRLGNEKPKDYILETYLNTVNMGRHAYGALVAGPWRVGVVARPAVEDAAADPFLHRGEVAELRDLDREVDTTDRVLERRINLGRRD